MTLFIGLIYQPDEQSDIRSQSIYGLTAAATAATSQQLCPSGKVPEAARTGSKYPVRESLTSILIVTYTHNDPRIVQNTFRSHFPPRNPPARAFWVPKAISVQCLDIHVFSVSVKASVVGSILGDQCSSKCPYVPYGPFRFCVNKWS